MPQSFAAGDLFPWFAFFSIMAFTWGACVGSFLNVCIYRIPLDLSVIRPRSHCPQCKQPIPWYLNIPLVSWLALRGRCAGCATPISPRYFGVELLTAALFLLAWLKFDFAPGPRPLGLIPIEDWRLVPVYWLLFSGLILGTFVDLEHMILPDRVTIGGIVAGLALSPLVPSMHGTDSRLDALIASGIGAAVGFGTLYAVRVLGRLLFRKEAMGFGDVKWLGAFGAFLGWKGALVSIVLSSFAGSVIGIALVLSGRKALQSKIPFGPYLALAAVLWVLWAQGWWQAYVRLLMHGAARY